MHYLNMGCDMEVITKLLLRNVLQPFECGIIAILSVIIVELYCETMTYQFSVCS